MIAMEPCMARGLTWWDQGLLPRDEFEERTRAVQRAMADAGFDAVTIWSSYYHTDGAVAYLAGWPMGGVVLLFREGEPILFSPGGSREHFFAAMQIWCEMRTIPNGVVDGLAKAIADRGLASGRIGIVGGEHIDVAPHRMMAEALAAFDLVDFTAVYRALTAIKRPRELVALRRSAVIARRAVEAGQAAFESGVDTMAALAAAERVARLSGARDFRGLANGTGHDLRPFDGQSEGSRAELRLWVAVDQHGYWSTAANKAAAPDGSAAATAVAAMVAAIRPGVASGDVAARGLAAIPPDARATALAYGLGGGIGLNLNEAPHLVPDGDATLAEGMVLSLQAHVAGDAPSFATATVRVSAEGAEWLTPR